MERNTGPVIPNAMHPVRSRYPMPTVRAFRCCSRSTDPKLVQTAGQDIHEPCHPFRPVVGEIRSKPAGSDVRVVHPKPVMASNTERISSRSRNPKNIGVIAPGPIPPVVVPPGAKFGLRPIIITRITLARSGIASVMPAGPRRPEQYAVSLKNGDR